MASIYNPQFNTDSTALCFLKPVNGVSELYTVPLSESNNNHHYSSSSSSPVAAVVGNVIPVFSPSQGGDTEQTLSLEEKLRRERTRQLTTGVTSFHWVPNSPYVIFPQQGNLFITNIDTVIRSASSCTNGDSSRSSTSSNPPPRLLYDRNLTPDTQGSIIDPKPSPNGKYLAFVQDNELYVTSFDGTPTTTTTNTTSISTASSSAIAATTNENGSMLRTPPATRVTFGARENGTSHGLADYIASEEFDRMTGYWWSPDGRYIAYQVNDDRHIPSYVIAATGSEDPYNQETHRYPFAGKANTRVRLAVIDVEALLHTSASSNKPQDPVYMDLGDNNDIYLGRVNWLPLPTTNDATMVPVYGLIVQLINRAQTVLDVIYYDALTGKGALLIREFHPLHLIASSSSSGSSSLTTTDPSLSTVNDTTQEYIWINVHDLLTILPYGYVPPGESTTHEHKKVYFIWGSERTGYMHLYLYSFTPNIPHVSSSARYTGPVNHPQRDTNHTTPQGTTTASSSSGSTGSSNSNTLTTNTNSTNFIPPPSYSHEHDNKEGLAIFVRRITGGTWIVENILRVGLLSSAANAVPEMSVLFSGTLDGPLERHMYCTPLFPRLNNNRRSSVSIAATNGSVEDVSIPPIESIYGIPGCRRITSGAGMHNVIVSNDGKTFADTLSSLHAPPSLAVYHMDAGARFATSPVASANLSLSRFQGTVSPSVSTPTTPSTIASPGSKKRISNNNNFVSSPQFIQVRSPSKRLIMSDNAFTDTVNTEDDDIEPWPLHAIVSFEKTGMYGPRVSVGVSLLTVAHGNLPVCSGTPPIYGLYKTQIYAALGILDTSIGVNSIEDNDIVDLSALKQLAAPVSTAVSNFAAKMSSRIGLGFTTTSASENNPKSVPTVPSTNEGGKNTVTSALSSSSGASFSFDSFGSSLLNFGAQAGAMLAGMGLTDEDDSTLPSASTDTSDTKGLSSDVDNNDNRTVIDAVADVPVTIVPSSSSFVSTSTDAVLPSSPLPLSRVSSQPLTSPPSSQVSSSSTVSTNAPQPPCIVSVLAADNTTPLYGTLLLPDPAVYGNGPYPTIVSVYGGPHVQRVKHDWATCNELRAQALRKEGYLVVTVDNRGSARRGLHFESHIRYNMGSVEVEDQIAFIRALVECRLTNPDRVGIYGWSYGGYMTLMCTSKAYDVFRVGVAGAPVTSWDGYDTGYTERYMGSPLTNTIGYQNSSIFTHCHRIVGKVLLIHGLMDENVHIRHTYRLISHMNKKNINYDFIPLPNERHAVRGEADKTYMENHIREYFRRYL